MCQGLPNKLIDYFFLSPRSFDIENRVSYLRYRRKRLVIRYQDEYPIGRIAMEVPRMDSGIWITDRQCA